MNARGFTLIELVMALVVMAVALAVVGLTIRVSAAAPDAAPLALAQAAREHAIREGRTVHLDSANGGAWFAADGTARGVIPMPDGTIARLDPLTGAVHVSRR